MVPIKLRTRKKEKKKSRKYSRDKFCYFIKSDGHCTTVLCAQ